MNDNITTDHPDHVIIIEPDRSWLRIPWRELLEYRDLLYLMVRRDFVSKYKQTILGPLWFIIQPLMNTLVFTLVFKKMAGLSTDGYPGVLFYMSGMLAWQYFSQCMQGTSTVFVANQNLFGKVYFPRMVVPLSVIISNLLAYALQLLTFLCFWVYFRYFTYARDLIYLTPALLALPLVILHIGCLALGVGLWMSALTAKYRDFTHLSGFLTQLWMFGTLPLFMSMSEIPIRYQWILSVNPVCPIVQWYRYAFLGAEGYNMGQMWVSVAVTVVLLITGILIFTCPC
ncbi:MAG: ABC transporter permease [Actinobacteria bacterium]|nr:ABC transporter permease [Actinomycetota bacterium]